MVEVENLPKWPENCNPMQEDLSNMGTPLAIGYYLLHSFHENEEIAPFVIVNTKTGERARITISAKSSSQDDEDYHNYWW